MSVQKIYRLEVLDNFYNWRNAWGVLVILSALLDSELTSVISLHFHVKTKIKK